MTFDEIVSMEPGTFVIVEEDGGRKISFLRYLGVVGGRYIEVFPLHHDEVSGFYTKANIIDGTTLIRRPSPEELSRVLSRLRDVVKMLEGCLSSWW